MKNYTFEHIRERILKWSQNDILRLLSEFDEITITKEEKDVLWIDLTFEYCLAQIIVNNQNFAPYQYISFEALTLDSIKSQESEEPEMIYFFYDSSEMLEQDVIDELNVGVKFCSSYLPDQLEKLYKDKVGKLIIEDEKICRTIHPDDIKKYEKKLVVGDFVCIGTQFQYLVVKNDVISLRVLPELFIAK